MAKPYCCVDTGPFFPVGHIETTRDLVTGPDTERTLYVHGVVTGHDGTPVSSASVMIWQADARGLYRHPHAADADRRDPGFLYYARSQTDIEGRYQFRTMIPEWYTLPSVERAAHIHFCYEHPSEGLLLSELYFDEPESRRRMEGDIVFQSRNPDARESLVTHLAPVNSHAELGVTGDAMACRFDLVFTGTT